MLDNNSYNLMAQLVEESQSLWRIRNTYRIDANMCQECSDFWQRLERQKEDTVRELERIVTEHTQVCETQQPMQQPMRGERRGEVAAAYH